MESAFFFAIIVRVYISLMIEKHPDTFRDSHQIRRACAIARLVRWCWFITLPTRVTEEAALYGRPQGLRGIYVDVRMFFLVPLTT
ncbi:hypothetical protein Enr17x_54650 [Gimesia fumaroli]|uniref:Uncharacterized protein n=1 Tax=Gimesia fumaroli TaxID=2527976 RepID=A0A518IJY1_9PLAN|nr:hypothetical protein Enr17x_54650 [Gimesia fumaroli]